MALKTVDARGLLCPQPLIETKKVLKDLKVGEEMIILIDNTTSRQNVERFLADNGATVACKEEAGVFRLTAIKRQADMPHPNEKAYCATPENRGSHVVCLKSDAMGHGEAELGSILMKAFVNTIKETAPLPSAVVCYNRGIFVALKSSPVFEALQALHAQGVRVLVCGTCLNYYGKKDELGVGVVSNMYDISQALVSAGHVVYP